MEDNKKNSIINNYNLGKPQIIQKEFIADIETPVLSRLVTPLCSSHSNSLAVMRLTCSLRTKGVLSKPNQQIYFGPIHLLRLGSRT